jgi:predicted RNA-binding protein with PUA domain
MGFAHVLGKKIFLLNDIPEISYKDEIKMMQPIILEGELSKITL